MSAMPTLPPLVLILLIYALFIKLAAKTYKKSTLSWKNAFVFSAMAILVGVTGALIHRAIGLALGPIISVVLACAVQLTLGGWYLGPRTKTPADEPVAFKGGIMVVAIAYGFVVLLGVATAILGSLLNGGDS